MKKYRLLDLFSGIGGFSLGLERSGGFETVAFCEIDPKCRNVLDKHWPNIRKYEDVTSLTKETLDADGIGVDAICGGFPCQDISDSGTRAGISGKRSGLWNEYARLIGELRPRKVIVENAAALLDRGLDRVLADLASLRYDAEWHCIPASFVGARHRRDRIWILAYPTGERGERCDTEKSINDSTIWREAANWIEGRFGWVPEPSMARVAHGIPGQLDRIKQLGNAVVPQIPELIGRAILRSEGRL